MGGLQTSRPCFTVDVRKAEWIEELTAAMLIRTLAFLAVEGFLAWYLWNGLARGEFALPPGLAQVDRVQHSTRYWTCVAALVGVMGCLAWVAWESFAWRYGIVVACAQDRSFCP